MALGNRRASVAHAVESSFGSIDSSTGLADASGLSFTLAEVNRASVSYSGQSEPTLEMDVARGGLGGWCPEPETMHASGSPVTHRSGTLTLSFTWRCPGSSTIADTFIGRALQTVMGSVAESPDAKDTVEASPSPSSTVFDVSTPGDAAVGQLVAIQRAGRIEFSAITDNNSGSGPLKFSPAFSGAPSSGDTMRYCATFFPFLGSITFASNKSMAFRVDTETSRYYAVGCRLQSLRGELQGADGRTLVGTAEFRVAHFYDDDNAASPGTPARGTGAPAKLLGSYVVYTGDIGSSSPATLARNTFEARSAGFELSWVLDPNTTPDNILGCNDFTIADFSARVNVTAKPVSAFMTARRNGEYRSILVGFGPGSASSTAPMQGAGMCVYMPASYLPDTLVPSVGDNQMIHEYVFAPGEWSLDTGTFTNGSVIDTPFRLGLVS